MGEVSAISWTHATFNPWIGCARVSPGCEHCYAEAQANFRKSWNVTWGIHGTRKMMSESYWKGPIKWNKDAEKDGERRRVFCASLADVFEDREELLGSRGRLAMLTSQTPFLDWLILTKRPENIKHLWPHSCGNAPNVFARNCWIGTTVEDSRRALERLPHLVRNAGPVRFLSCEPLLEDVSEAIAPWLGSGPGKANWVIVGGESGSEARPFAVEWARKIVAKCKSVGIPVWVKQMGDHVRWDGTSIPGEHWPADTKTEDDQRGGFRVRLKLHHGATMTEWPEDLRIQEVPV